MRTFTKPFVFVLAGALAALAATARGATVQYTYDADNRLTAAAYNTNDVFQYVFDAAGNAVQITSPGPAPAKFQMASAPEASPVPGKPPLFKTMAVKRNSGGTTSISFSWNAAAGVRYRLQTTDDLGAPWLDVPGDISAAGSTADKTFTDSSGARQRFFRLITVP